MHCAFVDLRKAFDSVERNALWQKLWEKGVSANMIRALMGIYRKVEYCTVLDAGMTE